MKTIEVKMRVEIPDNFTPCKCYKDTDEQQDCPFTYWEEENCRYSCLFDPFTDCPFKNI